MRLVGSMRGELQRYTPVFRRLQKSGQLPLGTLIACEVKLHGKYVDAVTLSPSGVLSGFEFKQGSAMRAVRQAVLNQHYVDKSYVVLGSPPSPACIELAKLSGVGVLQYDPDQDQLRRWVGAPVRPKGRLHLRSSVAARVADLGSRLHDAL